MLPSYNYNYNLKTTYHNSTAAAEILFIFSVTDHFAFTFFESCFDSRSDTFLSINILTRGWGRGEREGKRDGRGREGKREGEHIPFCIDLRVLRQIEERAGVLVDDMFMQRAQQIIRRKVAPMAIIDGKIGRTRYRVTIISGCSVVGCLSSVCWCR